MEDIFLKILTLYLIIVFFSFIYLGIAVLSSGTIPKHLKIFGIIISFFTCLFFPISLLVLWIVFKYADSSKDM